MQNSAIGGAMFSITPREDRTRLFHKAKHRLTRLVAPPAELPPCTLRAAVLMLVPIQSRRVYGNNCSDCSENGLLHRRIEVFTMVATTVQKCEIAENISFRFLPVVEKNAMLLREFRIRFTVLTNEACIAF